MTDKSEWIDASEALRIVERSLKGRGEAKAAIAECLRDGDVRSLASERWVSNARQIKDAWSADTRKQDQQFNVPIEPKTFRASKRWGLDQEEWRWPFNKFSISAKISPSTRRHMLAGVKLNRADIQRLILQRNPTEVGSPGKSEQWTSLCFAMLELEREGLLHEAHFKTMKSLREELLARINDGLSDKTIKPAISQLWRKFVKGHSPETPAKAQ